MTFSHATNTNSGNSRDERDDDEHALDERTLVVRLRHGDSNAFAMLMTQYAERLIRFARDMTGSEDVAEDVVQQVFVEFWERRATLFPERLKPYLFRAVRNRALKDASARGVRQRYRDQVQSEAAAGTIDAMVASPEEGILTAAAFKAALGRLPDRRRDAIRLRLEEGMTHAEIAEVLGISPAAAQSLVVRAIADLRQLLWGV